MNSLSYSGFSYFRMEYQGYYLFYSKMTYEILLLHNLPDFFKFKILTLSK